MNIWKRIGKLSPVQLWRFGLIFIKHPLLISPTLRATQQTFTVCQTLFGSAHHKRGKANAFRHALWNMLLCKKSLKRTKNAQKSVIWTQKLTNLYEKVTNNEILDQAMDLHNNKIGRSLFLKVLDKSEEEMVVFLRKELEKAQKVAKIEEIQYYQNCLVYLDQ